MQGTVRLLLIAVCCQLFSAFAQEPSAPSDMTYIPSGEFIMGNDEGTPTERPAHRVYLDAYYIARHEVTNAEYYAFWIAGGGAESSHTPISYGKRAGIGNWPQIARTKPDYPIVGVSWADAVSYAKWADKRLPTEAEWEKAARGNDGRLWPWGNIFSVPTHGITVHANVWEGNDGLTTALPPWGVIQLAQVPLASLIWQETSGNGSPIGIPTLIIPTVWLKIRGAPKQVADVFCGAARG